eukprot:673473-Rhodomonas_salina.1
MAFRKYMSDKVSYQPTRVQCTDIAWCYAISLRACYAISGPDVVYAATRACWPRARRYSCPTRVLGDVRY